MKTKLKRVMPVCLVVIFFIMALVAELLPISRAEESDIPKVELGVEGNQWVLKGMTASLEYNTESENASDDKWIQGTGANIPVTRECEYFIRDIATGRNKQILPVRNNHAIIFKWTGGKGKSISIKTTGDTYIDWGDYTGKYIPKSNGANPLQVITHDYADDGEYTVKIADNVVTYFRCDNQGVNSLDVSHNTNLIELYCNKNNISTLVDLTNNILLTKVSLVQPSTKLEDLLVSEEQFSEDEIIKLTQEDIANNDTTGNDIAIEKALYVYQDAGVTRLPLSIPLAPNVGTARNDSGTVRLTNIDATMGLEYSTDQNNWFKYNNNNLLQDIEINKTYYIRVAENITVENGVSTGNVAGIVQILDVKVVEMVTSTTPEGEGMV